MGFLTHPTCHGSGRFGHVSLVPKFLGQLDFAMAVAPTETDFSTVRYTAFCRELGV
jgi:hypothetical protein